MERAQPMELDGQNEEAIVDAAETRLRNANYRTCGICIDLYQFPYDQTKEWNCGHVFHGSKLEDITFEGRIVDQIDAVASNSKREAAFFVHESNRQEDLENMLTRSYRGVKHNGILTPYGVGYNTQISKVVSGYRVPSRTLAKWLELERKKPASTSFPISIPPKVQELIRTGYQAIDKIWKEGSTSDSLADPSSYVMAENKIKIHPLHIRDKNEREKKEDDMIPVRKAFANMIQTHIYPIWKDDELLDFVFLLGLPLAGSMPILGAPVLLSPARRELMYHKYDKAPLFLYRWNWLLGEANLGGAWKDVASNADPGLKKIIQLQAMGSKKPGSEEPGVGFQPNLMGALRFGSVVTSHYQQHVRGTAQEGIKGHVDWLLKKVLPRLLSRRYNADYLREQDS